MVQKEEVCHMSLRPSYWKALLVVVLVLVVLWIVLNVQYGSLPPIRLPL